jgi:hypothetical protein
LADGHRVVRAAAGAGAGAGGRASALEAANVGLVVAIVLLAFHGLRAGRAAHLRGWPLFAACSVAVVLGLVMILLKDLILMHRR